MLQYGCISGPPKSSAVCTIPNAAYYGLCCGSSDVQRWLQLRMVAVALPTCRYLARSLSFPGCAPLHANWPCDVHVVQVDSRRIDFVRLSVGQNPTVSWVKAICDLAAVVLHLDLKAVSYKLQLDCSEHQDNHHTNLAALSRARVTALKDQPPKQWLTTTHLCNRDLAASCHILRPVSPQKNKPTGVRYLSVARYCSHSHVGNLMMCVCQYTLYYVVTIGA